MGTTKKSKSSKKTTKPTPQKTRARATKISAHTPRVSTARRSTKSSKSRQLFLISKRSILAVIILAMLTVILTLLFSNFYDPEKLTTKRIEEITADYYETYFYPRIENYGTTDKSMSDIMSRYKETGFSKITLRQLLLFDSARHADLSKLLTKYCDPEATYVKIYPDEPYGKTDYHVDYTYSCAF
ncbi:hypothetical protein IKX73_00625 [Candidatus Saccharibacteria bacterium]|nr:hypothetical protein [Candidatus Saccharibacteria bacterium]